MLIRVNQLPGAGFSHGPYRADLASLRIAALDPDLSTTWKGQEHRSKDKLSDSESKWKQPIVKVRLPVRGSPRLRAAALTPRTLSALNHSPGVRAARAGSSHQ